MKLKVASSRQFQKDYKRAKKRGYDLNRLKWVVDLLEHGEPLPPDCCPHKLSGNYSGFWECHIRPDWLLIYKIQDDRLVLVLFRTGTHSNLF